MTEYRYTLLAIRQDGAIAELAKFKCRDLGVLLLQGLGDQYKGASFELEDLYREKSLQEILNDDEQFE